MRIRKRKVPLPLSLLSPVPLSDPHLFSRSPVMLGGRAIADDSNMDTQYSPPSDHLTTTCFNTSASDLRRPIVGNTTALVMGFEGIQTSTSVSRNKSGLSSPWAWGARPACPAPGMGLTTRSIAAVAAEAEAEGDDDNDGAISLSNNEGRWCDGDKAIPLKKRRGITSSNSIIENTSTSILEQDLKNGEEEEEEKDIIEANAVVVTSAKKGNSKRGNTIMEGSRCSRVNGRGWRCCQPTHVGYSLCEHHLGKGRLRSITSNTSRCNVKSRSTSNKNKNKKSNATSNNKSSSFALGRDDRDQQPDDNEKRMSSFGNKRVKLGVVKARSLSSLLGQTNSMSKIVGDATMQPDE